MGKKKHHFVLVHGGGHGAWCWYKLVPLLEKSGHTVTAIDLASSGSHPANAEEITSFEEYNQPLEDFFEALPNTEKVILVGHSLGGISLTYASEHHPQKIAVAVYIAAMLLPSGASIQESAVTDGKFWSFGFRFSYGNGLDRTPKAVMFEEKALRDLLYSISTPEDIAYALPKVRPIPFCVFSKTRLTYSDENWGRVPRIHILTQLDKLIPLDKQELRIPRGTPVTQLRWVKSDHSPFFSALDSLCNYLEDISRTYDGHEQ